MVRKTVLAALAVAALSSAACVPIASYSGFQAVDNKPSDLKIGDDTKSTVTAKLGSPSATSTFDTNTWFYISQVSDHTAFYKPRITHRDVVAVTFNKEDEKVAKIDTYTLKDGKIIAYNGRETPTRGRELTILEQILGNAGRGSILPNSDQNPGQGPGQ